MSNKIDYTELFLMALIVMMFFASIAVFLFLEFDLPIIKKGFV